MMQYGWAGRNPEKIKSAKRKHYTKNGEAYREYARQYSKANPEKVSAACKKWYDKNAEKMRERSRRAIAQWIKENPDRHRANQRNTRARRKKAEGKHSAEDIRRIRASQGDCCVYCHIKLNGRGHIDHRQPLSKGGTNWPSNIQITCAKCNIAKRDHDPVEFARSLGKLF
jgi:5-methylcytosine-specific restriction endonuclease McrA